MTEKIVDLDLVRSEGQTLQLHEDLPTANTLDAYNLLAEADLLDVEAFTGFTGIDSTKPANTKQYDDLGTQNRPGIEVQTTFTLQIDKRVDATKNTAYDAIRKAYKDGTALSVKHLNSDKSGRWATTRFTEARELPQVGEFLVLTATFVIQQFVDIPRPAVTP